MKKILFSLIVCGFGQLCNVSAQNSLIGDEQTASISLPPAGTTRMRAAVVSGDTMPVGYLHEVIIIDNYAFKNRSQEKDYKRLVRDIKKALPYAKMAGNKLKQYEVLLAKTQSESEKKKLMKRIETELKKEYGKELENLTMTQGRILLKLIDRETGDTSYEIVKELRGSVSAFFWQSMARLFGSDLKAEYDLDGKDKRIEDIVLLIEKGQI